MSDVVITKYGDDWAVRVSGSEETEVFETQQQALDYAHEKAKIIHGYVMMQNEEGELVQAASYRPLGIADEETDIALDTNN